MLTSGHVYRRRDYIGTMFCGDFCLPPKGVRIYISVRNGSVAVPHSCTDRTPFHKPQTFIPGVIFFSDFRPGFQIFFAVISAIFSQIRNGRVVHITRNQQKVLVVR